MMTMPAAIAASMAVRSGMAHPRGPSVDDYGDERKLRSFCIAFRPDNKIHLLPPSKQTAQLLKVTVEAYWTLDSEDIGRDCYTLNLEGAPFLMYSRRDHALRIKYICCLILEQFKLRGWELVLCTDLSSKTDLTSWYFARVPVDAKGRPLQSRVEGGSSVVCLSLSAKRKLQLINAPKQLQTVLTDLVLANYDPGLDQEAHYGHDYQIKLKGSPWSTENRDEIVAASKLITSVFREFGAYGFHLYGLVNLKDTADSLFFEYDPSRTFDGDDYMLITLDDENILRLINTNPPIVDVVKRTIDRFWLFGLEAEGHIGSGGSPNTSPTKPTGGAEMLCWEFVLKGSPWKVPAMKIGQSRQFITFLLDALLASGWTVVTGLDITRSLDKKSALLFQRCPPVRGLYHACLSPLGKQRYQLINAPASLRHLVRVEFGNMVIKEKLSDDDTVYEIVFDRSRSWWTADPEQEQDSYIYTRKRIGRLLEALMDCNWRVIASADVARQTEAENSSENGEGIHSWFVVYCGSFIDISGENPVKVTANTALQVGTRTGGAGHESMIYLSPPRDQGHRASIDIAAANLLNLLNRSRSFHNQKRPASVYRRRAVSPPPISEEEAKITAARRSRSGFGYDS